MAWVITGSQKKRQSLAASLDQVQHSGSNELIRSILSWLGARVRLSDPHPQATLSLRFYDQQIPSFVEAALDQRYGNLYASMPQLALYSLQGVSTYTEWSGSDIRELFLYRREPGGIIVINQGMTVDGAAVQRFANAVFQREPSARRLRFESVQLRDPHQLRKKIYVSVSDDMVIDLPDNPARYLAQLGRSLRQSLQSRLRRTPGLRHQIISGETFDTALLERIIRFNHARMAAKQRTSAIDSAAFDRLLCLARARGSIGTVEIDGRLCAGSLICRFGDDVFSLLNAHDPAMNALGLGKVSRHLMILEAIRTGAKRFHLLGGYYGNKRAFGARYLPLYALMIYRNRFGMFLDGIRVGRLLLRSLNYQLRYRIEVQRSDATNKLQRSFSISSVSVLPRHQRRVSGLWRE